MHVHPRPKWWLPKHRLLIQKVVAHKHCRVGGTGPSTSRTCTSSLEAVVESFRRCRLHTEDVVAFPIQLPNSCQQTLLEGDVLAPHRLQVQRDPGNPSAAHHPPIDAPIEHLAHLSSTSRLCDASRTPHDHASSSHSNSVLADNIAHIENLAKCQSSAVHEYRMEAKPCPSNS